MSNEKPGGKLSSMPAVSDPEVPFRPYTDPEKTYDTDDPKDLNGRLRGLELWAEVTEKSWDEHLAADGKSEVAGRQEIDVRLTAIEARIAAKERRLVAAEARLSVLNQLHDDVIRWSNEMWEAVERLACIEARLPPTDDESQEGEEDE